MFQKRRSIIKNKKAQETFGAEQMFFVLAFLFAAAITIVILYFAWSQMSDPLETAINTAIPAGESSFNITTMNSAVDGGIFLFDVMFPFLILGLIIMSLVFAFLSNGNPVFIFLSIFILIIAILLGVVFSNIYQQIISTSEISEASGHFSIITIFMQNFPLIITIISVITIIALVALGRKGGTDGL